MDNPYSLILKEYVRKSGMSLTEIETELRKKGFKRNKAYLSNLQNGKLSPPPFEETRELCNVIGGDAIRLGITGVLMGITDQEFFSSIKDTVSTMIATLLEINKEGLKEKLIEFYLVHFPYDEFEDFEEIKENEDIEKIKEEFISNIDFDDIFFNFDNNKNEVDDLLNQIPWHEVFLNGIKEAINQIKGNPIEVKEEIEAFKISYGKELSFEESEYLKECLNVYRKLNLKPSKG